VIFCHLRIIREWLVTVGYICYRGNNHVLINEMKLGGIAIEKRQGMEVLGAYLSPSMSIKDQFVVRPHVMLNACLTLSWSDNSFRPQSRVAKLRSGPNLYECAP
jgi:hypothetical protein